MLSNRARPGPGFPNVCTTPLGAIPCAQVLGETSVRRVEIEKARTRRAPEPVDDLGRGAGERTGRKRFLFVVDQDAEATLEDVERIGVPTVVVRTRTRPRAVE